MNTVTNDNTGKEINLHYADSLFSGYGHQRITVEVEYKNEYYKTSAVTSDMPGYDAANELEGEERQLALYELIESKIDDSIAEFIESVDRFFVIEISFGEKTEYWNSSAVADGCAVNLIENAESFKTEDEANEALEDVKDYAEASNWVVTLSVKEK